MLTSLAILKVNWDTLKRDYLDNFLPLVVECIRLAPQDVVSLSEVHSSLQLRFGLTLPLNPIRALLKRASKAGFVRRDSNIYIRDAAKCAAHNFEAIRTKVAGVHDVVVAALSAYAAQKGTNWTSEESQAALLKFLADHSLELLYAKVERTVLSVLPAPENGDYFVGAFLHDAQTTNPALFGQVESLARGYVLASALYLPDPGVVTQRFDRTEVYLDTSLIVYAAGYAGAQPEAPVRELLSLLQDYGATVRCFEETVNEVRGILDACAHRLRSGNLREAFGPTIDYLIETGRSASDVELMAARLTSRLAAMGIKVESMPPFAERQFQVDEEGFEEALQTAVHYSNPKARVHDVACVSGIARVRRGHNSYAVETCRAVFVTPNLALARTARAFFQPDAPPGAIALCITDHALGSMLWLKNPTKAPDLPTKALIADAYAAIQPPDGLWKLYLAEIARLADKGDLSKDAYHVLRHAQSTKATLMDLTHGDADAFSEGTVQDVLAVAQASLTAGLRADLEREARRRAVAEEAVTEMRARDEARDRKHARWARSMATVASRCAFAAIATVLVVGTLYSFPWTLPELRTAWWRYLLGVLQACLFGYTVLSIMYGSSVKSLADRFKAVLEGRLLRSIKRRLE